MDDVTPTIDFMLEQVLTGCVIEDVVVKRQRFMRKVEQQNHNANIQLCVAPGVMTIAMLYIYS